MTKAHLPVPRLIAVDLDGTLLDRDKQIDPRTLRAIQAVRQAGAVLVFVTGRTAEKAEPYIRELQPEAAVLSYGAHILIGGRTVFRRYMSPQTANKVLTGVQPARCIRYQTEDGIVYTDQPKESGPCRALDRAKPISSRVDHLCAWSLPEETARRTARENRCSLTQLCGSDWCNFSAYGCGKGNGLKRALSFLSVPAGSGIAFGDEDCDIGFFRVCGTSVAMANADQRTLAAADYITESNGNAGIAVFLERYIL